MILDIFNLYGDYIIASGSVLFTIALIPQLRDAYTGKRPMNVLSALMTGIILLLYCIVYASKGMWLAAIPITAITWLAISYYSWRKHEVKYKEGEIWLDD